MDNPQDLPRLFPDRIRDFCPRPNQTRTTSIKETGYFANHTLRKAPEDSQHTSILPQANRKLPVMSVEIEPQELGFRRPFTVEVAQILKIKNTNSSPVAFKVKTTAPKQYCVRPNSGRIEPGHDVDVSVLLQAMKTEPPADARCRDKFLVQSVTITGDKEFSNVTQIWDSVEKSAIQERKIRVTWLPPSEDGNAAPVAATPARKLVNNGAQDTPDGAAPPAYSSPNETAPIPEIKKEPSPSPEPQWQPQSAVAAAASTVKKTAVDTAEDLKAKLAQAEATIASLKTEAANTLRQRKPIATSDDKGSASATPAGGVIAQAERPQGTEGVPVQIVAALCLVSFLLAYFFF